ncbi:MAG: hexose kinase [Anaerolineae bacterium]|nr:hexose kinase [Anaerolineae bacterium]
MFLTVTGNSALDRVVFIDRFEPETVMRTNRYTTSVGGKGFDTSVVFRALGQTTMAVGLVAGLTGELLHRLLEQYGMLTDLVWTDGETRTAFVISETALGRHSHIITGALDVKPHHLDALVAKVRAHLGDARWCVAAGSLAPDMSPRFFADVAGLAHQAGVPVLVDTTGPALAEAARVRPTILKSNRAEFCSTFGVQAAARDELIAAARAMFRDNNLHNYVMTLGKDGILALAGERTYHAIAPQQQAVNAAGAGDSVSAALVWRLDQGDDWPAALQWAGAVSAAVTLTEGTADCRMEDAERIHPDVIVTEL